MSGEVFFRVIFAVCLVVFSIFRMTRKVQPRSSQDEQRRTQERESIIGKVRNKVIFPWWLAAMILYPWSFGWFNFFALPFPIWLRWSGIALAAISLPLFWQAHQTLNKYYSPELKLSDSHQLITYGPYRWVRHPMYTIIFMLFISACLISANLLVIIPNILAIIFIYLRITHEEKMLVEKFGDAYRAYRKRTGKLLPRLFVHKHM